MARRRGNGQGTLYQRKAGGAWIASWYDAGGRRLEKSTRTTDRRAAERMLAKWAADATLRREGIIDVRLESLAQQARRPLVDHLADFEAAMTATGATLRHVELVVARVRRVVDGCGFKVWADVSASRVADFLNGLRADKVKRDEAGKITDTKRGTSAQTFNFYVQSVKQWCRWMVKDRRASDSPVAHLEGLNVRTDRRRDRRALTADELRKLLDVTEHGPIAKGQLKRAPVDRFGMTGSERAMLYRLAVETGLRAGELRSLTRASFNLDAEVPSVTVSAAYSKRRREDVLPLRPSLAKLLAAHLANKSPAALAFPMPVNRDDSATMFHEDREAAGIAMRDDADRVVDFHALRHTFISNLAAGGVHPKIAQALARHSTITLTMDRYSHSFAGDEVAALAVLPDLSAVAAVTATGTAGAGPTMAVGATAAPANTSSSTSSSGAFGRIAGALRRNDDGGMVVGSIQPDAAENGANPANPSGKANGERGIRTLGGVNPTPVFETGPFSRSGISPGGF